MCDFDARAKDWDSDQAKVQRGRVVAEAIRAKVPLTTQMTALEFGCGTGLLSFALRPYLGWITLIDSSEGMLTVLRDKLTSGGIENMKPMRLDLLVDPLPEERFDLIYALMTLHHVSDTDRILKHFHALLKQAGRLCIADLDQEDGSFHGAGFDGHNGFDRNELAERAVRAGFQDIDFTTVFHMKKEVEGGERTFPVFLMVAEKV